MKSFILWVRLNHLQKTPRLSNEIKSHRLIFFRCQSEISEKSINYIASLEVNLSFTVLSQSK